MLINRNLLLKHILLLALTLSFGTALAQQNLTCIENTDKPVACEHLIVKIADPRVVRSSLIESSPVCICLSDFPSIYADNSLSKTANITPEEKLILDSWQLSLTELNQLLRF